MNQENKKNKKQIKSLKKGEEEDVINKKNTKAINDDNISQDSDDDSAFEKGFKTKTKKEKKKENEEYADDSDLNEEDLEDEVEEEEEVEEEGEEDAYDEISHEDEDLDELDNKPAGYDENEDDEEKEENYVETHHLDMDMDEVNLKIKEIVETLSDLKKKAKGGKSRSEYTQELKHYCKIYYDYNEDIMTLIMNLFAPNEAVEFLEASASQRVMSIRTNTLKTKRRELAKTLINRGVNLDPLAEWTKVGLKIFDSQVPVGATPEYLSGQYMLQSGSSFLPVMALEPKENDRILDMCACPGGKTTYIAQLLKNTGVLVANDLKPERLKSLYFNIHRLGVKNTIITNYDGKTLSKLYRSFDRVLLDAPCSGLGVISKDPTVKMNRVSFLSSSFLILIISYYFKSDL